MSSAIPATALGPVDRLVAGLRGGVVSPVFFLCVQSSEGQNARRFFSSFCRVVVVGFGSIFVVLGVHFGAILETLGSILVTLGSPGALFEVRASIWSPMAPEMRKRRNSWRSSPPGWVPAWDPFLCFFVFWLIFRVFYVVSGF